MDYKRKRKFSKQLEVDLDQILSKLGPFKWSQKFYAVDKESMIAIDEENKKICIINNQYNNLNIELSKSFSKFDYKAMVFNYNDILQSEIIEDNNIITKTSRSGQLGGAILGSILAGGVGAVIGSLGASKTSSTTTKKMQLQIVVNNSEKSFYRILFSSFPEALPKTNYQYKKVYDEILHWHNILSYLIKSVDENELNNIDSPKEIKKQNLSISNELLQLSELLKNELITKEEYEKLKMKIIN